MEIRPELLLPMQWHEAESLPLGKTAPHAIMGPVCFCFNGKAAMKRSDPAWGKHDPTWP